MTLLSVVVPVTERPMPLSDLYLEYSAPLKKEDWSFEFLFILEPWDEPLARSLEPLVQAGEPIRVLRSHRTLGEAAQLKVAASQCRGDIVITLPAYHRIESQCIPELVRRVEAGADLAVAWRLPRRDSWVNRLQNRVFHLLIGLTVSQRFHDVACGVRAMRPSILREIPLYGDFSRFLPLLAVQEGFSVEEITCPQHSEDRQARVYSPGVYFRRLIDLFGIFFLLRFTYKPLRFFGLIGGALFSAGAVVLLSLVVQRVGGQAIADRPMLLLGALLFSLGIQVIALGLVGELIVHLSVPSRLRYRIREIHEERSPAPATVRRREPRAIDGRQDSTPLISKVGAGGLPGYHVLSVDVEEYFQGSAFAQTISRTEWNSLASRVERQVDTLLNLLDQHEVHATFFVLAWVADRNPQVVRRIADGGHEIASHGWWHRRISSLTQEEFREEARSSRAILEELSGKPVLGFRAPNFSLLPGCEWVLDVLLEEGYRYDSSIFPGGWLRRGYPGARSTPHIVEKDGGVILELPPASIKWAGIRFPAGGGAYFRHLPYGVVRGALREAARKGHTGVFYIHPWEFDADQPRLKVPLVARIRHYRNLHRTLERFDRLLCEFRFAPVAELFDLQSSTRLGETVRSSSPV